MQDEEIATLGRQLGDLDLGLTAEEAVEVIKDITGTTDLADLIPDVWAAEIEREAQEFRVMRNLQPQVIINTELLDAPGKDVNIPKLNNLTPAIKLTEGIAIVPQKMSDDVETFTPEEWGTGVELTRKLLRRAYIDVMEAASELLGESLAQAEDVEIITQAIAAATTEIFPDPAYTGINDITATDILTPDVLVDGRTALRIAKSPGPYAYVINPAQEGSLLKDDQFVDASKYGSNDIVLNGEIGRYLGMRILISHNIPTVTNATSIVCYKSMIFGRRSLAVALKANPDFKEDYDVKLRVHVIISVMEFDTGALNADRYAVVITA